MTVTPLNLSAVTVSTFPNAKDTAPTNRPLAEIFAEIRNGKHRAAVAAVLSAFDTGGKDAAAPFKRALPAFTVSGTFTRRANDALTARSGLIVADIDDLPPERLASVRASIEADPLTVAAFTSPTGTGCKVVYRCDPARPHAEAFAAARAHVLDLTGEEIDPSGKDVSRLCFVSDDAALFINEAAAVLLPAPDESEPVADLLDVLDAAHGKPDAETVAALLGCIPPRPAYGQWLRIASAVWDALGESAGCAALDVWSAEEHAGEYRRKYRARLLTVKSGTLFYIAAQHAPERVAAIKSGVGAVLWFTAKTWGESFASAWQTALETDKTTPRPALAVRLLTAEADTLNRRGFAAADLPEARARLVTLSAVLSSDPFAAEALEPIAARLLGVKPAIFRKAVKAQTEANQAKQDAEAMARAVAVLDIEGASPLLFDGSTYWRRESHGAFGKLCREDALLHLNEAGLSKKGDPSPRDAALHTLQMRNRVDYAGPLCGRPAGLHHENGLRVLATRGPVFIEGVAGDWQTIDALLSDLLGRAAGDAHAAVQRALVLAWLNLARAALRNPAEHRPGQVLGLVGPADCGKSLLQSAIITPALGGRTADPALFFVGATDFNADLWGAEHLSIGDKALDVEGAQRSALRNELKRAVAEPSYPLHGKNRDGQTFRPIWRISLSANDDAESASNLPPLDGSFSDKIIYLRCYAPPAPFFDADKKGAREAFAAKLRAELSAFVHAVDSFTIPGDLRKARFGVTEWHHPAVLELLGEGDPLRPIADVLESWIASWGNAAGSRVLPTVELFQVLDAETHGGLIRSKICTGPKHLGHQLAKLAEKPEWRWRLRRTVRRHGGRAANLRQACWEVNAEDLM